jgi:hypothetical protein
MASSVSYANPEHLAHIEPVARPKPEPPLVQRRSLADITADIAAHDAAQKARGKGTMGSIFSQESSSQPRRKEESLIQKKLKKIVVYSALIAGIYTASGIYYGMNPFSKEYVEFAYGKAKTGIDYIFNSVSK